MPDQRGSWKEIFAVDLRSLALFRIAFALLILIDLAGRVQDLTAHYTDWGVLPREALNPALQSARLTLHAMGGSPEFVVALFAVQFLAAGLLLVGYRTRWAAFVSWILLVSLQHRNWHVLNGGDIFLRSMLMWGLFLPLGARWSWDALRARPPDSTGKISSVAGAALLLQVWIVYFFSAVLKWQDPSWHDGTAVYYALALDTHATAFGKSLLAYPTLLRVLTHATLWFELIGSCLLFFPFRNAFFRLALVFGFWIFQTGLGLTLELGLFPWVSAAAMLPFLPGRSSAPFRKRGPRWTEIAAACLLAYVLYWNLGTVLRWSGSPALWNLATRLGLDQGWMMYASPRRADGWFIVPARLSDSTEVDLLKGRGPVRDEKPIRVSSYYRNVRWSKYMGNLWDKPGLRPYFAWYLCHRWNRLHPENPAESLDLLFLLEETAPDNPEPPARPILLGRYTCLSK
jgi:hypothetical protein